MGGRHGGSPMYPLDGSKYYDIDTTDLCENLCLRLELRMEYNSLSGLLTSIHEANYVS